jgi:hypothetical protein
MRTALVGLALLIIDPSLDAVPAPDSARLPKQRLEALKRKLPDVVGDWMKQEGRFVWLPNSVTCAPEVRVVRRVAPERAKAVILFAARDQQGVRDWRKDVLLNVFLTYQDGTWTTEKFEVFIRSGLNLGTARETFAFLMMDIDEAAEKP